MRERLRVHVEHNLVARGTRPAQRRVGASVRLAVRRLVTVELIVAVRGLAAVGPVLAARCLRTVAPVLASPDRRRRKLAGTISEWLSRPRRRSIQPILDEHELHLPRRVLWRRGHRRVDDYWRASCSWESVDGTGPRALRKRVTQSRYLRVVRRHDEHIIQDSTFTTGNSSESVEEVRTVVQLMVGSPPDLNWCAERSGICRANGCAWVV